MNDSIIEQKLKTMVSNIEPNRALFDQTLDIVTKQSEHRHIYQRNTIPSPYQSIFFVFMKKFAYIGTPIIALAIVAITLMQGPSQQTNPIVATATPSAESPSVDVTETAPTTNAPTAVVVEPTQEIDAIVSSLIADASADADAVLTDTTDAAFLNAELETVNTINSTNYDNIIS